jgi:hypothetical protein
MTAAEFSNGHNRDRIYRGLLQRNRVVGWLRIGVPLIGLAIFAVLAVQIVIANLAKDYGAAGIRLERDSVIIDKPTYSGVMANGTRYEVVADAAEKQIAGPDVLDLQNVRLNLVRNDGYRLVATAEHAFYDLLGATITIPGLMVVDDSDQTHALLRDNLVDWNAQTLVSKGDVDVHYPDGTVIEAVGLNFDGATSTWVFGPTVLTSGGDGS